MDEKNFDDLVKLLGIGDRSGTADIRSNIHASHVRFEFGSMPEHEAALATVLAALALVGLAFWLYKREGTVALWKKVVLATLRGLTILMAFAMLLEPRLAADRETVERASTIVLWDDSLSMSLTDRYLADARRRAVSDAAGITSSIETVERAEIAWRVVERANLLKRLAEKNELKVYAWSRGPARLLKDGFGRADVKPRGEGTDLATAVRAVLEKESGGGKIAAIVAITDGRINEGEGPRATASMLADHAIPFYAIGIGDPTPPKNLELAELVVNERAYKNDPLIIEGRVRHSGYAGEKVDVEFLIAPESNPTLAEKIRTETVELHGEGTTEKVSFTHVPKECGSYIVTLRVPPRDEEVNKEDNQKSAEVKVVDDETKVLLIAGSPTFEFRFLRNMLSRDKTVKLSSFLQTADNNIPEELSKPIDALPRTKELLMGFDVVLLMDPNPAAFDRELVENLKWFVGGDDKGMGGGGGLLYVAGEKYTTSFFRAEDLRSILDLIPVVPDLDMADNMGRGPWTESWPFKLTEEAEENTITRLDPSLARSKLIWPKLPGAFWHYPVLREKPGGAVLVRHADSRTSGREPPLVTAHFYGRGRAIFNSTDETWRWRAVAPKSYDRFWVQALRFLAEGKLVGGGGRASLLLEKTEFSSGEPIRVRARAKSHDPQKPYEAKELQVKVTNPDTGEESSLTLKAVENGPGRFEGMFEPKETGKYELSLRLPDAGIDEKAAVAKLVVKRSEAEFTNPRLDEETLREIAASTGGALVELSQPEAATPTEAPPGPVVPARQEVVTVKTLPDKIPDRTELVTQPSEPLPLWDNRITLILGCILLGVEWFFRKRCRMV